MIGTRIRGFHHFIRLVKALGELDFLYKHDGTYVGMGKAIFVPSSEMRNPYMGNESDYVVMFNNTQTNVKYNSSYQNKKYAEVFDELYRKYGSLYIIPVTQKRFRDENIMFAEKVALPADFNEKFEEFLTLNKKQLEATNKYCEKTSSLSKWIYTISSGSKNFYSWAINAMVKSGASLVFIERVLRWNDNYNQLAKKLKKGTITAYTNINDFANLSREITILRREKRANDTISMFNTTQKKALKSMLLGENDYEALSKFGKLSYKKKINFIKKMSTVDDAKEILKQMSFLADIHFEWNKQSLLDCIANSEHFNCEVVLDKGDIVLLKVKDYETVKRLAKTTNWCISKDKKYWIEYVESKRDATQYVIFDFSRKEDDNLSIVGFTAVHDRGITNAHDFQNKNLMNGPRHMRVSEIKSFVSSLVDCSNIYGILDRNGISLSDIITYQPSKYEWNRESMFEYLSTCISDYDYYIVADDDDKVAFIAESEDIKYFLGDSFMLSMAMNQYDSVIIFADFSKKATSPDRLVFGIIHPNFKNHESKCSTLYNIRCEATNQSFDSKLEEYNLPYDIICRTDNVIDRFYSAINNLELTTANELIKNKKVANDLSEKTRSSTIENAIKTVCFSYNSLDYINLFYNNGYTLSDLIGEKATYSIVRNIISYLRDIFGRRLEYMTIPTEGEISSFEKGEINDRRDATRIGFFTMLMKIIENESSEDLFRRVVQHIHENSFQCDLFDVVVTMIINKLNMAEGNYDTSKYIASYACNIGSSRVKNALDKKGINPLLKSFIDSSRKNYSSKVTEFWVRNDNGIYTLEGVNEEAIAHAPRRR